MVQPCLLAWPRDTGTTPLRGWATKPAPLAGGDHVGAEDIIEGVLSALERRYRRDVEHAHGLPAAKRQVRTRLGSRSAYLDNLYAVFCLIVELDGLEWHPAAERWLDIRRDNVHASSGFVTLRYNWADVTVRPCEVASEVARCDLVAGPARSVHAVPPAGRNSVSAVVCLSISGTDDRADPKPLGGGEVEDG